jgi:hypothetical protein
MSTLKSALRPPKPPSPSPPKPKKSMTKRAIGFMKKKMGMDSSSESSPSPPKKSMAKRASRYLKRKMGIDVSPSSSPSSPHSPSPRTRRVRFDENVDDNNIKQNPYRLRGKRPTKHGPDDKHYLTEDEMKKCYGPLNPSRELEEFVQQIYDKEFHKTYRELKTPRKTRTNTYYEVYAKIGTADEFFERYQDAIDSKAEYEMMNKKQELKEKQEREWLEKLNKEHEDMTKTICLVADGFCACSVITLGIFLARYYNLLGGGSRKRRQKKTRKQR